MRTSLNEIKLIESYLQGRLCDEDREQVEKRLAADYAFRINIFLQRKVHQLLNLYHNEKLKMEISSFHDQLMKDPCKRSYSDKIRQLFNP
jgi:hypothetical protein